MIVTKLYIENFRNYDKQYITFCDSLNVLVGDNAQGKTNLLEAIFILAIAKSPRTSRDKDLIKWGCSGAKVKAKIQKKSGEISVEMRINEKGQKSFLVNDIPIKRYSELLGELNVIYFFPDDLKLIKDSPTIRRKFMDIDISQASKNYFYLLQRYEKILAQRNKLLKTSSSIDKLKSTVSIWDEQLADIGSKIILSRMNFLTKLAPLVEEANSYLTGNAEKLSIFYTGIAGNNSKEIKDILLNQYRSQIEKDFSLGFTTIGPHRDDIEIKLNGIDLKAFGSQGQQRTASLAMKLAEIELFYGETSEKPVLLLDDVLSELDASRREKLIERTKKLQTIITCTEFPFDTQSTKQYRIVNGHIEQ